MSAGFDKLRKLSALMIVLFLAPSLYGVHGVHGVHGVLEISEENSLVSSKIGEVKLSCDANWMNSRVTIVQDALKTSNSILSVTLKKAADFPKVLSAVQHVLLQNFKTETFVTGRDFNRARRRAGFSDLSLKVCQRLVAALPGNVEWDELKKARAQILVVLVNLNQLSKRCKVVKQASPPPLRASPPPPSPPPPPPPARKSDAIINDTSSATNETYGLKPYGSGGTVLRGFIDLSVFNYQKSAPSSRLYLPTNICSPCDNPRSKINKPVEFGMLAHL
jgi:hypothetical protein